LDPTSRHGGNGGHELPFGLHHHQSGPLSIQEVRVITNLMIVTLVFCLGNLDDAINSATGQPYVQVLLNATQSTGATIALTVVMLILLISCAVNTATTSSRQLWSFARDGGPPFSTWLSRVRPGWDVYVSIKRWALGVSLTAMLDR